MKAKFFWHMALVLVSLAAFAGAESIQVTLVPPESRMGGPISGQRGNGSALNGDYYYPYFLTLSNGGTVMVACDDYFDSVNVYETWTADTHGFADLQGTLFYNSSSDRRKYEQVAWLFDQFSTHPFPDNNRNAAINVAMWDIFDSRAPDFFLRSPRHNPLSFDPYSSAAWIAQARAADLTNYDFSRFVIYTPTQWNGSQGGWGGYNQWCDNNRNRPQELMGKLPTSPVPEPPTAPLWLGGLTVLGWAAWKRRRTAEDAAS